jgi:hypothetical protein
MVSRVILDPLVMRQDGFGTRATEDLPPLGHVERLVVSPALSTPGSEQAIRARASHLTGIDPGPIGRVLRIERKAATLTIYNERPDGVTLSDILAALEFGTLTLSDEEVLELAASVTRAASTMHQALGALAHGALSPSHIVLGRDGSATFTCAIFGDAIQALKRNREHLWREFGLALPAAAGQPRFDQRGDVTQLGAAVLAIVLRRSLRRDEFPRGVADLIASTAIAPGSHESGRLRTWLQDALQLHGRVVFASAVEAGRRFARLLPTADEARALALRTAILQLQGDPVAAAVRVWRPAQAWNPMATTRPAPGERHASRP